MARPWKRYFKEGAWLSDPEYVGWFFEEDGLLLDNNDLRPFRVCSDCDDPLCGSPGYRTQCADFYAEERKAEGGLIGKSYDKRWDQEPIPESIICDKGPEATSPFAFAAAKPIDPPSKRKTKSRKRVSDGSW